MGSNVVVLVEWARSEKIKLRVRKYQSKTVLKLPQLLVARKNAAESVTKTVLKVLFLTSNDLLYSNNIFNSWLAIVDPMAVDYQPSFETEWWKLKLLLLPSRRILVVFHDVFCKALIMRGIMRSGAVHTGLRWFTSVKNRKNEWMKELWKNISLSLGAVNQKMNRGIIRHRVVTSPSQGD